MTSKNGLAASRFHKNGDPMGRPSGAEGESGPVRGRAGRHDATLAGTRVSWNADGSTVVDATDTVDAYKGEPKNVVA